MILNMRVQDREFSCCHVARHFCRHVAHVTSRSTKSRLKIAKPPPPLRVAQAGGGCSVQFFPSHHVRAGCPAIKKIGNEPPTATLPCTIPPLSDN